MNKDFVEVTSISGSNNGEFDVVCEVNEDAARSTVITVEGGGISKTINVNQNMNDKVYPLAYYIFPFTIIENYTINQEGVFYMITADVHITKDVKIVDALVGLYNLKALKSDIDLVTDCMLKQVAVSYDNVSSTTFEFNVIGSSSSNKYNGVGFATIPINDRENLINVIQKVIDSKTGYIIFSMMFGNTGIIYKINILSN